MQALILAMTITLAARLRFAFQPSDRLSMDLSFNYSESEVATGPYQSKSTLAVAMDHDGNPATDPETHQRNQHTQR